ncbi:MAG: hypothetical protein HON43_05230 [Alphaproteobacteria bacterium]|mgnify:CR=1 FL=1|jgi:hypothetical protein|nr:hypothetical protein [Alphaproteobacteria bacterium]MBT5389557.1 hypothetical protein [Alphaproteobacteria bacterium]
MKTASTIISDIKKDGYSEFVNVSLKDTLYISAYQSLDEVVKYLKTDKRFVDLNNSLELDLEKVDTDGFPENSYLGFNCLKSKSRKTKVFLHYNEAYHETILEKYRILINEYPFFALLLSQLKKILDTSNKIFQEHIHEINKEVKGAEKVIYTQNESKCRFQ